MLIVHLINKITKVINKMSLPVCCGKEMKISMEVGRFVEAKCSECGDVVYVKKYSAAKPILIDD